MNSSGSIVPQYDAQDRLKSYGGTSYTYTENGELQTKTNSTGPTNYTYSPFGELLSVQKPDGTLIEYVHDAEHRRVGKKVNGTLVQGFLYQDRYRPVAVLDGSGNLLSRFIYGSKGNVPDYFVKGSNTYRILSDHLGSPRVVVDTGSGNIVQKIDYDEFGNVTSDTNPGFIPFGFAGGLYDEDTGLVRFGWRDYDPMIGRWTAKDPLRFRGGQGNLYGYTDNDPIDHIDSTGEFWWVPVVGGIVGGVAQGFANYDAWKCGKISGWQYAESIGVGVGVGAFSSLFGGFWGGLVSGFAGSLATTGFNASIGAIDGTDDQYEKAALYGALSGGFAGGLGKIGGMFWQGGGEVLGQGVPLAEPPADFGNLAGAIGTALGSGMAAKAEAQ
jgi:RHS repeat-associated protein